MSRPKLQPRAGEVMPLRREYWWLARVWILVLVFATVTAVGSLHFGVPVRDPHGVWFVGRIATSLGLLVLLALVDAVVRTRRRGRTLRATLEVLRARWTRRRLALVITGLLAYHVVYLCYRNLKSWNVFNEPRDGMLQRWDRALFFGHSPAVLLHDFLGQHAAAYVLTVIYVSFSSVVSVSFVAALAFTDRVRQGYVFVVSAMWVWILGVGAYYLIPSLGPFSHAPEEFAGLPHTTIQDKQARYLAQREHLLAEPQAHDATAQIAAFASLHVAMILMLVLMARYYGLRGVTHALTIYLAGTMLATIYLGWHYVVDLPGGVVIACIAVLLGRMTIYPQPGVDAGGSGGRPRTPSPPTHRMRG